MQTVKTETTKLKEKTETILIDISIVSFNDMSVILIPPYCFQWHFSFSVLFNIIIISERQKQHWKSSLIVLCVCVCEIDTLPYYVIISYVIPFHYANEMP